MSGCQTVAKVPLSLATLAHLAGLHSWFQIKGQRVVELIPAHSHEAATRRNYADPLPKS